MIKLWRTTQLGEIVREEHEPISVFDGAGLPVLGVTNVEGVTQTGVEASDDRSKYLRLRPGRFVYNPYRVNVGSLGLSADSQEGICSPAYVVFAPTEQIDAKFLFFFLKSARGSQLINFHGNRGSVRSALRFHDLCQIEIPLPPLAEQRRIVTRIEELASRIASARGLRQRALDYELPALRNLVFGRLFQFHPETESFGAWPMTRLHDLCSVITDGTHQTPHYVDEGMPFLSAQNVKPYRFMPEIHRKVSLDDYVGYTRHTKPEKGDILMTRVGAMIGEAAMIDCDLDFAFYVSLCLMKPRKDRIHAPYLVHWLNSPFGVAAAKEKTLGKGHSQGNLNLKLIREFRLPLPSLEEQIRLTASLDEIQAGVNAIRSLQLQTAAELDALMPSILDKAFRGEL